MRMFLPADEAATRLPAPGFRWVKKLAVVGVTGVTLIHPGKCRRVPEDSSGVVGNALHTRSILEVWMKLGSVVGGGSQKHISIEVIDQVSQK